MEPFDVRCLAVGGDHVLYVEQVGARAGRPIVFLHGGPGSGCQPAQRQLFDPARDRVVMFDQRGAGRSTPKGTLVDNTTAHLVSDVEAIREALEIERWTIVGGSWGATLAIAYAEAFPERVTAIVLRAVFLGTEEEVRWAFGGGPRTLRPDLWAALVARVPPHERRDPYAALGRRLEDPDPAVHVPAACVWGDFERTMSEILPASPAAPLPSLSGSVGPRPVPSTPYVEHHYFRNECFLRPNQLMAEAHRLDGIPGILVQGRYDLLCPPKTAHALAAAWHGAELRIVEGAGHATSDPGTRQALVAAIAEIAPGSDRY